MTEYADRDIIGLRDYYTKHVMAMTAEGLHSKDDIAAELAYRDEKIAQLEARITELESERRRDALDGQAALDEANNRVKALKRRVIMAIPVDPDDERIVDELMSAELNKGKE